MAGRLIVLLRWIALALLLLAVALIIIRWRFPALANRGGGFRAWIRELIAAWLNHREDQREHARNTRALRKKAILLADPDPKSLRVMTWKLERLGCSVQKAKNGAQAISMAARNPIDVIFADALLPDISASDFHRSLPNPTIPVVFLGVLPNQWDTLTALGPTVACLTKPYDPEEATSQAGRLLLRQV